MNIFNPVKTISPKRAIGRPHLPGLIKKGFSTVDALKWLSKHNASYRKTDFLNDWRQILGIQRKKDPLKYVRKKYLPTNNVIEPTYDNLSARYKATYKVLGHDKLTGELKSFYVSAVSDIQLSMKNWDELADIVAHNERYERDLKIDKIERESMLEKVEWEFD